MQPALALNQFMEYVNLWAEKKGWNKDFNLEKQILNLHTEISEAWEDLRNNHTVHEIYFEKKKPCGFETEIADLVIRVFHLCAFYNIDLEKRIKQKMRYNETRPYRHGNKTC